MYRWAGERPNKTAADDETDPLYVFKADNNGGGSWSKSLPSNTNYFSDIRHGIDGASGSCGGKGFYLGGWANDYSDGAFPFRSGVTSLRLPGILTYDIDTRTWSNDSTTDLNTNSIVSKSSGVCITGFGESPLFFTLGGNTAKIVGGSDTPLDFNPIKFYDPSQKVWYSQPATGDIPDTRVGSCVTGVHGSNGTYEIFMYGGINEEGTRASLDDIWILSLPAFHWFRIEVTAPARHYHSCNVVGNRQMLVFGGSNTATNWTEDDEWSQAIGIFDMTELNWSDGYDAAAGAYQSPKVVREWYEQEGVASVGWSNQDIKTLFENGSTITSSDSPTSTSTSTSSSETPAEASKTPVGAIAGGVVGGVAAVCLVGAAFYFYRRRSQRQEPQHERVENLEPGPKELDPHKVLSPAPSAPSELADPHASRTPPPWELESHEHAVELDAVPHGGHSKTRN